MEAVVGAVSEQDRLVLIGALVEVVAELVMRHVKILAIDLEAGLHAQVGAIVDVPGRGVAIDLAVARPREQRARPERRRQRGKSERGVKTLGRPEGGPAVVEPAVEQDLGLAVPAVAGQPARQDDGLEGWISSLVGPRLELQLLPSELDWKDSLSRPVHLQLNGRYRIRFH